MNSAIENEKKIDTDDYFLLAARSWKSQKEDYTDINDSVTSRKYFDNYPDAELSFQNAGASVFPGLQEKDIKIDLIHVRFGINRLVLSRIVV